MFNAIINLLLILVAAGGLGAVLGILVHGARKRWHFFDVFLITVVALSLIKCIQFAVWASLALYDKYTESAIQIHTVITI